MGEEKDRRMEVLGGACKDRIIEGQKDGWKEQCKDWRLMKMGI